MNDGDDHDLDRIARELAEIGVGAAILGLRQVNIGRRRLAKEHPELAPAIDAVLDGVDRLAEPSSKALGSLVTAVGDAVPGTRGTQIQRIGNVVADLGPELLRLSGLTKRDRPGS